MEQVIMFIGLLNQLRYSSQPQAARLFRELRPGLREVLLRAHLPVRSQRGIGTEIEARLREADRICSMLGQRYVHAFKAEKQGRTAEAISLYEQNVADGDLSTLSYERLHQLYLKMDRRHDAVRVCEAYLRALAELVERDPGIPQWVTGHRKRFQGYLAEMK
jgi:hypothetical protein